MEPISLTYIALALIIGIIIGFVIAKAMQKKPQNKSLAEEKGKLENEVLRDEVKQLTAKVATLEKALELSQS